MKRKKLKSKKDKPPYDENGKWVDQDMRILGGIRKAYRFSPQMKETIDAARVELPPKLLKNGKPGKRNQVRFKCAACKELFSKKNVQADHVSPATPLWASIKEMTWDNVVKGIFCKASNLQVLCSTPMIRNNGKPSCHAKKSREENWIRKKLTKWTPDVEEVIEKLKIDYQQYLVELEEKKIAKEERKKLREAKRALKLAKSKKKK